MRERTYDAYRVQNDAQGNDGYGYRGSTSGRGAFGGFAAATIFPKFQKISGPSFALD